MFDPPAIVEGSVVRIKGEDGTAWVVRYIGVALGLHHLEATLDAPPAAERWVREPRVVPVDQLDLIPPDLEDWPCSPV